MMAPETKWSTKKMELHHRIPFDLPIYRQELYKKVRPTKPSETQHFDQIKEKNHPVYLCLDARGTLEPPGDYERGSKPPPQ
jgi:hypothetical protein